MGGLWPPFLFKWHPSDRIASDKGPRSKEAYEASDHALALEGLFPRAVEGGFFWNFPANAKFVPGKSPDRGPAHSGDTANGRRGSSNGNAKRRDCRSTLSIRQEI